MAFCFGSHHKSCSSSRRPLSTASRAAMHWALIGGLALGYWLLPSTAWSTAPTNPYGTIPEGPEPGSSNGPGGYGTIPESPEPGSTNGPGGLCKLGGGGQGMMFDPSRGEPAPAASPLPIAYYSGAVIESATDLELPGPTFGWSQRRTYNSKVTGATTTELGRNWISGNGDMRIVQTTGSNLAVIASASSKRSFTYDSMNPNTYIPPSGTDLTLVHNSTKLELTNTVTGEMCIFHDFTQGVNSGRLAERTTRAWKAQSITGQTYTYDAAGKVNQITCPTGQDSVTIQIIYISSSWKIRSIAASISGTDFLKVEYTYKRDSGTYSSDVGGSHDLIQVKSSRKASDGTNWIARTTQYRYDSSGKLKAVFEPEAVQRIIDDNSNISSADDILTQADSYSTGGSASIASFASRSFEYFASPETTSSVGGENLESKYGGTNFTETGYVKSETINGSCASCGGGSPNGVKFEYHYMNGTYSTSHINVTRWIVVEDMKKASNGTLLRRNIYGLSADGLALRKATTPDPTAMSPSYWCTSQTYDNTTRRLLEDRSPSAHASAAGFDIVKFFNATSNGTTWTDEQLGSTGLITVYTYTGNWPEGVKIKNGSGGTAYYVSGTAYGDGMTAAAWDVVTTYNYPTTTATLSAGVATTYAYTYQASTFAKGWLTRTITGTAVPTGENGPNTAAVTTEQYDTKGRLIWIADAEGYLQSVDYDAETGGVTAIVRDAAATMTSPSRGGSLPSALALPTRMEYDDLGRQTKLTDQNASVHYTVYLATRTIQFPNWNGSTASLTPIQVSDTDDAGRMTKSFSVAGNYGSIAVTSNKPTGFSSDPTQSNFLTLTKYAYNTKGQLDYVDRYHNIPASSDTLSTHFYRTVQHYDDYGRQEYTVEVVSGTASSSSTEQVTKTVYDGLDRVTEVWRGVSDDSHNMTTAYTTYPTLVQVSATQYDSGAVGDGHVTKTKTFYDTSTYTGAIRHYNFRGQLRGSEPIYDAGGGETAIGPFMVQDVDWRSNVKAQAAFVSNLTWASVLADDDYAYLTQTDRRALTRTDYDVLGRPYSTHKYTVNSSGVKGTDLIRNVYRDRLGQQVASEEANAAGIEMAYDGAGRLYQKRTVLALNTTKYSSSLFQYQSPVPKPDLASMSGGDDAVIQMTHTVFDTDSDDRNEVHTFEMNHDDTGSPGIDLSNNDDYVRRSVFFGYDGAHRVKTIADYGSADSGGLWKYATIPSMPGEPSVSSSSALVTLMTYDTSGRQEQVTDPAGVKSKTLYDALGRRMFQVQNFDDFAYSGSVSGTGDGSDRSKDQAVGWEYNGLNSVTKLTAYDQNGDGSTTPSDDQLTEYVYTDTIDVSRVRLVKYPDGSTSGNDNVKLEYFTDGTPKKRTDQRGTVIEFTYNGHRQRELQRATTLGRMGHAVDGAIRSLKNEYDSLARPEKITSYSNDDGTGTVENQVKLTYDIFGHMSKSEQSHQSAVGMSTPAVEYGYSTAASTGFSDGARLEQITYPNARVLYYDYGTSDAVNDRLHRVQRLRDVNSSGTILASYSYSGVNRPVLVDYEVPDVKLDYFQGTTSTYAGIDRFGRIKDQYWDGYNSTSDVDRIAYTYDYAGNRTARDIASAIYGTNDKDQAYTYDGLHRLTVSKQGTLSGGSISGTPNREQDFTLDALGNWKIFKELAAGPTTTLDQTRTHNAVNEVGTIGVGMGGGTNWSDPTYDEAGNMITGPQPKALGSSYTFIYDAWNRLVQITASGTIATYEYDGLNRRIAKGEYVSGSLSKTRHYYYSESWQVLEERVDAASVPNRQFVWGPRYVDELIVRDRDADASSGTGNFGKTSSGLEERLYSINDALFNVVALTNTSGAVQQRFGYDPYGTANVLAANFSGTSDGYDWEYRYTGREYDSDTGLQLNRNRYYHGPLGRWVNRDPIGYKARDMNLYRYVAGGPTNSVDPLGLKGWRKVCCTFEFWGEIWSETRTYDYDATYSPSTCCAISASGGLWSWTVREAYEGPCVADLPPPPPPPPTPPTCPSKCPPEKEGWTAEATEIILTAIEPNIPGSEFIAALEGTPDLAKIAIIKKFELACLKCRQNPPPCDRNCKICKEYERVKTLLYYSGNPRRH